MDIRLRAFATEVTCVTLEVGSQGKLGGQAVVPDVEAVWEQLPVNVSRRVFVLLLCDYNDVFRSIGCMQT